MSDSPETSAVQLEDSIPRANVKSSPGCQRCETVPSPISGPGILHLKFPLTHTLGKIRAMLAQANWKYQEEKGTLSVEIPEADLSPFLQPLCQALSTLEQEDIRAIFEPSGQPLQIKDYFEVASLRSFAARAQSDWLLDILQESRLTMWFQPIVSSRDSRIFAYECLMRGQDNGQIVFPDRILDVARNADLLFQLDRAARVTAIREAARFHLSTKLFINFTPTSIYDPRNCLQTTVRAVEESRIAREQVVFEVIESESVHDTSHLRDILNFYRDQGFLVALDDIGSGYSSLNMISRLRPDFMKLDRELISGVASDDYKATIAQKLLETAQALNVTTIAEGVETEDEFNWLCRHGADYLQGYYIARPATPPPMLEQLP